MFALVWLREMATATIANPRTFWTGPWPYMSQQSDSFDIKMTEKAAIAKEGRAPFTGNAFPLWMTVPA